MAVGVLLIVLAVGVVLLASASVAGVDTAWAGPLFLGGLALAVIGAVVRR